ncbi:MAG: MFS transporter [bacterium]
MKNRKEIISWCLYDFANSSYSAVIAAVVFPVYFANVIVGNEKGLGDLWWGRAVSISMVIVALTSPFLGGIADYLKVRKRLLLFYTSLSVVSVFLFTFLKEGMIYQGVILVILANIGMEGGLVFYNAFLPEIAEKDEYGRVSSWGFGVGYSGSILSLLIALYLIKAQKFNFIWLSVSLFFLLFSLPAFLFLPKDRKKEGGFIDAGLSGIGLCVRTFKDIFKSKNKVWFLAAYFVYEDGVNTVIVFSSIFAATTLHFSKEELIFLYLFVQFVALIGSFVMAKPIDRAGPKRIIKLMLLLWLTVSISSSLVVVKKMFWLIAGVAGFGLGVIQASSRALFAKFIPKGKENDYFGIYSLVGKTSAVIGPVMFGTVSSLTGSQRPAVLAVSFFFLLGYLFINFVKEE